MDRRTGPTEGNTRCHRRPKNAKNGVLRSKRAEKKTERPEMNQKAEYAGIPPKKFWREGSCGFGSAPFADLLRKIVFDQTPDRLEIKHTSIVQGVPQKN